MDNKKLPISKVPEFIKNAQRLGCYTDNQRTNFEASWSIMNKVLAVEGLSLESTIEDVQSKLDPLFDHYGRQSPAGAESIRVYRARIKRLLTDFIQHNGADFMAWKKTLEKTPTNGDTKPRKARKTPRKSVKLNASEDNVDGITQALFGDQGKRGSISLPKDLTESEVEKIWKQLDAIKTLVLAQITPSGAKSA